MIRLLIILSFVFMNSCGDDESLTSQGGETANTTEVELGTIAKKHKAKKKRLISDTSKNIKNITNLNEESDSHEQARTRQIEEERKRKNEALVNRLQSEWDVIKMDNPRVCLDLKVGYAEMNIYYNTYRKKEGVYLHPVINVVNKSAAIVDGFIFRWSIYDYDSKEKLFSDDFEYKVQLRDQNGNWPEGKRKSAMLKPTNNLTTASDTRAKAIRERVDPIADKKYDYAYAAAIVAVVKDGAIISDRRINRAKAEKILSELSDITTSSAQSLRDKILHALQSIEDEMLQSIPDRLEYELIWLKRRKKHMEQQRKEGKGGRGLPDYFFDIQQKRIDWLEGVVD